MENNEIKSLLTDEELKQVTGGDWEYQEYEVEPDPDGSEDDPPPEFIRNRHTV